MNGMTKQIPTLVIVVIGAGSIGQAIARRVSAGKHVVLADLRQENADMAAKTLSEAGFNVSTAEVDVSLPESVQSLVKTASSFGEISGVIHTAGVSPSQASPEAKHFIHQKKLLSHFLYLYLTSEILLLRC